MNLPNQLSILRILLTPVFIFLLNIDNHVIKILSFVVFGIAALTDYYDGYIARKFGYITRWGQFIDPLADKVLVIAGLVTFSLYGYYPLWMVIVIAVRDFFMTWIRWLAIQHQRPIQTNYFAKIKTAGQITLLILVFLFHLITWNRLPDDYPNVLIWMHRHQVFFLGAGFIVLITVISAIIYWMQNKKQIAGFFASKS